MRAKKKSLYESKIESLMTQNETESNTIKELLSPAAFEKLKKAQSALPKITTRRRKLRDFNGFTSKEPFFQTRQVQLKKSVEKKPEKDGKKRRATIFDRRINDIRNAEVKILPKEIIETVEKEAELQGILDKIEKEAGKSQLAFTMKPQSCSFEIDPKEVEPLDGCALEVESYELWEPKVELLEGEEDVQFPQLPNLAEMQSGLQKPKENEELPISYVSVEQLSRLVGIQKEPDIEECPFQMQIFQLSAVPVEGMCGLAEIKKGPENVEEGTFSYFPVDQQSNFYLLN